MFSVDFRVFFFTWRAVVHQTSTHYCSRHWEELISNLLSHTIFLLLFFFF